MPRDVRLETAVARAPLGIPFAIQHENPRDKSTVKKVRWNSKGGGDAIANPTFSKHLGVWTVWDEEDQAEYYTDTDIQSVVRDKTAARINDEVEWRLIRMGYPYFAQGEWRSWTMGIKAQMHMTKIGGCMWVTDRARKFFLPVSEAVYNASTHRFRVPPGANWRLYVPNPSEITADPRIISISEPEEDGNEVFAQTVFVDKDMWVSFIYTGQSDAPLEMYTPTLPGYQPLVGTGKWLRSGVHTAAHDVKEPPGITRYRWRDPVTLGLYALFKVPEPVGGSNPPYVWRHMRQLPVPTDANRWHLPGIIIRVKDETYQLMDAVDVSPLQGHDETSNNADAKRFHNLDPTPRVTVDTTLHDAYWDDRVEWRRYKVSYMFLKGMSTDDMQSLEEGKRGWTRHENRFERDMHRTMEAIQRQQEIRITRFAQQNMRKAALDRNLRLHRKVATGYTIHRSMTLSSHPRSWELPPGTAFYPIDEGLARRLGFEVLTTQGKSGAMRLVDPRREELLLMQKHGYARAAEILAEHRWEMTSASQPPAAGVASRFLQGKDDFNERKEKGKEKDIRRQDRKSDERDDQGKRGSRKDKSDDRDLVTDDQIYEDEDDDGPGRYTAQEQKIAHKVAEQVRETVRPKNPFVMLHPREGDILLEAYTANEDDQIRFFYSVHAAINEFIKYQDESPPDTWLRYMDMLEIRDFEGIRGGLQHFAENEEIYDYNEHSLWLEQVMEEIQGHTAIGWHTAHALGLWLKIEFRLFQRAGDNKTVQGVNAPFLIHYVPEGQPNHALYVGEQRYLTLALLMDIYDASEASHDANWNEEDAKAQAKPPVQLVTEMTVMRRWDDILKEIVDDHVSIELKRYRQDPDAWKMKDLEEKDYSIDPEPMYFDRFQEIQKMRLVEPPREEHGSITYTTQMSPIREYKGAIDIADLVVKEQASTNYSFFTACRDAAAAHLSLEEDHFPGVYQFLYRWALDLWDAPEPSIQALIHYGVKMPGGTNAQAMTLAQLKTAVRKMMDQIMLPLETATDLDISDDTLQVLSVLGIPRVACEHAGIQRSEERLYPRFLCFGEQESELRLGTVITPGKEVRAVFTVPLLQIRSQRLAVVNKVISGRHHVASTYQLLCAPAPRERKPMAIQTRCTLGAPDTPLLPYGPKVRPPPLHEKPQWWTPKKAKAKDPIQDLRTPTLRENASWGVCDYRNFPSWDYFQRLGDLSYLDALPTVVAKPFTCELQPKRRCEVTHAENAYPERTRNLRFRLSEVTRPSKSKQLYQPPTKEQALIKSKVERLRARLTGPITAGTGLLDFLRLIGKRHPTTQAPRMQAKTVTITLPPKPVLLPIPEIPPEAAQIDPNPLEHGIPFQNANPFRRQRGPRQRGRGAGRQGGDGRSREEGPLTESGDDNAIDEEGGNEEDEPDDDGPNTGKPRDWTLAPPTNLVVDAILFGTCFEQNVRKVEDATDLFHRSFQPVESPSREDTEADMAFEKSERRKLMLQGTLDTLSDVCEVGHLVDPPSVPHPHAMPVTMQTLAILARLHCTDGDTGVKDPFQRRFITPNFIVLEPSDETTTYMRPYKVVLHSDTRGLALAWDLLQTPSLLPRNTPPRGDTRWSSKDYEQDHTERRKQLHNQIAIIIHVRGELYLADAAYSVKLHRSTRPTCPSFEAVLADVEFAVTQVRAGLAAAEALRNANKRRPRLPSISPAPPEFQVGPADSNAVHEDTFVAAKDDIGPVNAAGAYLARERTDKQIENYLEKWAQSGSKKVVLLTGNDPMNLSVKKVWDMRASMYCDPEIRDAALEELPPEEMTTKDKANEEEIKRRVADAAQNRTKGMSAHLATTPSGDAAAKRAEARTNQPPPPPDPPTPSRDREDMEARKERANFNARIAEYRAQRGVKPDQEEWEEPTHAPGEPQPTQRRVDLTPEEKEWWNSLTEPEQAVEFAKMTDEDRRRFGAWKATEEAERRAKRAAFDKTRQTVQPANTPAGKKGPTQPPVWQRPETAAEAERRRAAAPNVDRVRKEERKRREEAANRRKDNPQAIPGEPKPSPPPPREPRTEPWDENVYFAAMRRHDGLPPPTQPSNRPPFPEVNKTSTSFMPGKEAFRRARVDKGTNQLSKTHDTFYVRDMRLRPNGPAFVTLVPATRSQAVYTLKEMENVATPFFEYVKHVQASCQWLLNAMEALDGLCAVLSIPMRSTFILPPEGAPPGSITMELAETICYQQWNMRFKEYFHDVHLELNPNQNRYTVAQWDTHAENATRFRELLLAAVGSAERELLPLADQFLACMSSVMCTRSTHLAASARQESHARTSIIELRTAATALLEGEALRRVQRSLYTQFFLSDGKVRYHVSLYFTPSTPKNFRQYAARLHRKGVPAQYMNPETGQHLRWDPENLREVEVFPIFPYWDPSKDKICVCLAQKELTLNWREIEKSQALVDHLVATNANNGPREALRTEMQNLERLRSTHLAILLASTWTYETDEELPTPPSHWKQDEQTKHARLTEGEYNMQHYVELNDKVLHMEDAALQDFAKTNDSATLEARMEEVRRYRSWAKNVMDEALFSLKTAGMRADIGDETEEPGELAQRLRIVHDKENSRYVWRCPTNGQEYILSKQDLTLTASHYKIGTPIPWKLRPDFPIWESSQTAWETHRVYRDPRAKRFVLTDYEGTQWTTTDPDNSDRWEPSLGVSKDQVAVLQVNHDSRVSDLIHLVQEELSLPNRSFWLRAQNGKDTLTPESPLAMLVGDTIPSENRQRDTVYRVQLLASLHMGKWRGPNDDLNDPYEEDEKNTPEQDEPPDTYSEEPRQAEPDDAPRRMIHTDDKLEKLLRDEPYLVTRLIEAYNGYPNTVGVNFNSIRNSTTDDNDTKWTNPEEAWERGWFVWDDLRNEIVHVPRMLSTDPRIKPSMSIVTDAENEYKSDIAEEFWATGIHSDCETVYTYRNWEHLRLFKERPADKPSTESDTDDVASPQHYEGNGDYAPEAAPVNTYQDVVWSATLAIRAKMFNTWIMDPRQWYYDKQTDKFYAFAFGPDLVEVKTDKKLIVRELQCFSVTELINDTEAAMEFKRFRVAWMSARLKAQFKWKDLESKPDLRFNDKRKLHNHFELVRLMHGIPDRQIVSRYYTLVDKMTQAFTKDAGDHVKYYKQNLARIKASTGWETQTNASVRSVTMKDLAQKRQLEVRRLFWRLFEAKYGVSYLAYTKNRDKLGAIYLKTSGFLGPNAMLSHDIPSESPRDFIDNWKKVKAQAGQAADYGKWFRTHAGGFENFTPEFIASIEYTVNGLDKENECLRQAEAHLTSSIPSVIPPPPRRPPPPPPVVTPPIPSVIPPPPRNPPPPPPVIGRTA